MITMHNKMIELLLSGSENGIRTRFVDFESITDRHIRKANNNNKLNGGRQTWFAVSRK